MRPSLIRNGLWVARPACKTSLISVAAQSAPSPPEQLPLTLLSMTQKVNQPTKQTSGGRWSSCSLASSGAKKAQFPPRGRGAVDPSQLACAHQNQNHLKMPTTQPKIWPTDKQISFTRDAMQCWPMVLTNINWKINYQNWKKVFSELTGKII